MSSKHATNPYTVEEVRAVKAEARRVKRGDISVYAAMLNLYGGHPKSGKLIAGSIGERHTYESIRKMLYNARQRLWR